MQTVTLMNNTIMVLNIFPKASCWNESGSFIFSLDVGQGRPCQGKVVMSYLGEGELGGWGFGRPWSEPPGCAINTPLILLFDIFSEILYTKFSNLCKVSRLNSHDSWIPVVSISNSLSNRVRTLSPNLGFHLVWPKEKIK